MKEMELKLINELIDRWKDITWKVIEPNDINIVQFRNLIMDTYELLDSYSNKVSVDKELISLILEMHELSWWVCTSFDAPFHCDYQEITTLIQELTNHLLGHRTERQKIEALINRL